MPDPFVHILAGVTVCSRLADLWTTYLVTPKLKLEANSIVRRFGWKFAFLTVFVGLVPYLWPPLGVIVFTMSFMVAAFNASRIVTARALGEDELAALTRRVLLATPPWPGLAFLVLPGVFTGILGCSLLLFYPEETDWGQYFGLGMVGHALVVFVWYPVRYFRVRADARRNKEHRTEETQ